MADEAGCQFDQRFVVLGPPLGADPHLPIARESGQGSLDIPARLAEPRAMLGPPFCELGLDPTASELIPERLGVIASIPLQPVRSLSWPALFSPEPSAPHPPAGSPG